MYFEALTRFLILLVKAESLETSERVDEKNNSSALAFTALLRPEFLSIRIVSTNLQFSIFVFVFWLDNYSCLQVMQRRCNEFRW